MRRFLRLVRNALIGFLSVLTLLLIAGAIYQLVAQARDARRFPQQGRSIALGPGFPGESLNIDCTSHGNPVVVLDSGGGVPAIGWSLVQPEIAKFTRVCSYDRAGYGWSGPGPLPRTSIEIARELHALLETAGEKPPYVLVAHSLGGFNVRVYNHEYPDDVAGMVLVDTASEDQLASMSPRMRAATVRSVQTVKRIAPLMIRFGLMRLQGELSRNQPPAMSKELRDELLYLRLQPRLVTAEVSEMESAFGESADEVRAAGNLGDKPLIVLTGSEDGAVAKGAQDVAEYYQTWVNVLQVQQAHLSTRGRRVMVSDSGHMIPYERPDAVVSAVREVFSEVRTQIVGAATRR